MEVNEDMKNSSMIEDQHGWTLSPTYDLLNVAIVLPKDSEELALTLKGKKRELDLAYFESFGDS